MNGENTMLAFPTCAPVWVIQILNAVIFCINNTALKISCLNICVVL